MLNDRLTKHDYSRSDEICYDSALLDRLGHVKAEKAVLKKLADYEDKKYIGRLFITKYAIGDFIYFIFQDEKTKACHISEHIVYDISVKGYIATCPVQVHDEKRVCFDETDKILWSPDELEKYHACESMYKAERIVKDLGNVENSDN